MIIEAVTFYMALVTVFVTYVSKAMQKFALIGWVLPLVFPLCGLAWGGKRIANPRTLVDL
jgi:hypothetical protein